MKGNFLDAIYDCPFEMHELVTDEDISRAIFALNDAQKELLYQLAIKGYSCQLIATFRALTDRNIRKIRDTIDTHTVHEKEIIQLRLNDTNGIENFVKNFAKAYYSWDTSKEAIEARITEISKYITKELQNLNADTIRTDIPTSATITNVLVWNVEQSGTDDFTVAYEVDQQVKAGEQTQAVAETYTVTVHVDKDGAMVITQNPTLAPMSLS